MCHLQFWRIWIKKFTSTCFLRIKEEHVDAPHAVITLVGWDVLLLSSQPQNQAFWQKNKAELWLSCWFDLSMYRSQFLTNKNEKHGDTFHILGIFFFTLLTVHWLLSSVTWPKTWTMTWKQKHYLHPLLIAPFQSKEWEKIWKYKI